MMSTLKAVTLRERNRSFRLQKLKEFFLRNKGRHFTAREVYLKLSKNYLHISPSTIYRQLRILEREKEIQRMTDQNGVSIYELTDGRPHDHLICAQCSRTIPLYDNRIELIINQVAEEHDTQVESRTINIYVSCLGDLCPQK